jgi:site-specific recombinase XerD
LLFEEIDESLITEFLDHLESHQGVSARSRNQRLAAIHSFFRFAAFQVPTRSGQIQQVLAIPSKRFTRTLVQFLTRPEVDALLAAPDQRTWSGRRDHALILLAAQAWRPTRFLFKQSISRQNYVGKTSGAYATKCAISEQI